MDGSFGEFADSLSRPRGGVPALSGSASGSQSRLSRQYERVAILGGGPDACILAALCLSSELRVSLFSAYGSELDSLRASRTIGLGGSGPIGHYHVDSDNSGSDSVIHTTAELDRAVSDADLIFLTGGVHKRRTYSMVLSDHLRDNQTLVVCGGGTFGALECHSLLRTGGCSSSVTIVEMEHPYWHYSDGSTHILTERPTCRAATLPGNDLSVSEGITSLFPNVTSKQSVLHSSLLDGSGLVEVPGLCLGGVLVPPGGPDVPMEAESLPDNHTFFNLLGDSHCSVIDSLATERRIVASSFGVRTLPTTDEWITYYSGSPSGEGSRPVPSHIESRSLVRDAIIGSLIPLSSLGLVSGIPTPHTDSLITLGSSILGANLRDSGRSLGSVGIHGSDRDSVRSHLERLCGDQKLWK